MRRPKNVAAFIFDFKKSLIGTIYILLSYRKFGTDTLNEGKITVPGGVFGLNNSTHTHSLADLLGDYQSLIWSVLP